MDWWLVIAIAAVVVVGMRYLRSRRAGTITGNDHAVGPPTDFTQDREDNRISRLSTEDQAWEAASQQRSRDAQKRDESVTAPPT